MNHKRRAHEQHPLMTDGHELENGDGGYLDEGAVPRDHEVHELDTEKKWRTVTMGTPSYIIEAEGEPICVFPRGIHLILASNPSKNTPSRVHKRFPTLNIQRRRRL